MVDTFQTQAASIVSVNNAVRSVAAAIGAFANYPAEQSIGPGNTFVILAILNVGAIFLTLWVYKYGEKQRAKWKRWGGKKE